MKNKNELTYVDIETIQIALHERAKNEEEYADHLRHSGDEEAAAPHYNEANECERVIRKLRAFTF